jgi:hypothetical protein
MDNNYISTKKKRTKYNFHTSVEDFRPELKKKPVFSFFYQIATFADSSKYHMRKYVFDDTYTFVKVDEYRMSAKDCKKFYTKYPSHKYKRYDVESLDDVNKPSLYDLQTSISTNLNPQQNQDQDLNSMYATFTNDSIDYSKLHRNLRVRQGNALNSPLDDNVITDFASF